MERKKPLILISNDDGYAAKGVNCLAEYLCGLGDIIVCAPDGPRSGYSCAFSATQPLTLTLRRREEGMQVWSCNGTPVDCVKMAYSQLCDRVPDLIISGINHGDNSSVNSHYSGTMGVAREGAMKAVPSVAFSLCNYSPDADFSPTERIIKIITGRVLDEGLPKHVCLNVNFPDGGNYKGVRVCRMGDGIWEKEVVKGIHPRGQELYWMVGEYRNLEPLAEDTDAWALANGYVAVTPTTIDVTAYGAIGMLRELEM